MNYFRITGYSPKHNFSFILDAHNVFEKIWQFSKILISNDIKVIAVSSEDKFQDINIERAKNNTISIRAISEGQHEIISHNGLQAIKITDKIYIPDRNSRI